MKVEDEYGTTTVRGSPIMQLLRCDEPNYLSSLHDGNRYLFRHDAAWLRANGFGDCFLAATRALVNQDPSNGATNWYDSSIKQPYSSRTIELTARIETNERTLVSYRFR